MPAPVRIRSQTMLLIYKNLDVIDSTIISHLRNAFGIQETTDPLAEDWFYVFRLEHCVDGTANLLVFIELYDRPDVLSRDLEFNGISPDVMCSPQRFFLLRLTLTFVDTLPLDTIVTNLTEAEISDNAVILQSQKAIESEESQSPAPPSSSRSKPPFTESSRARFEAHATNFTNCLALPPSKEGIEKLKRLLNNMTNYRNQTDLPLEFDERIDLYRRQKNDYVEQYKLTRTR